jgi:hypothetical protein
MTTEEIRQTIHQLVDSVQDDLTLVDLHAAVALIIEQQDLPINTDTPFLQDRMNRALEQITHGTYISNEAMKQEVRQWLSK